MFSISRLSSGLLYARRNNSTDSKTSNPEPELTEIERKLTEEKEQLTKDLETMTEKAKELDVSL